MGSSTTNKARGKNDENDVNFRRTVHARCMPIQAEPETVSSPYFLFFFFFTARFNGGKRIKRRGKKEESSEL
jgi:hypothetical protein